ncbi:Hypothetical predicted protein [Podarcis lilfordi]|uniref:Uncharacterized protein n=1 Tax=Podarcis lilfordi TaxID=74358 RepID=A0AA35P5A1_9SAUR|nr:Hypothetical predicted protein [Podarcis lilfordi]
METCRRPAPPSPFFCARRGLKGNNVPIRNCSSSQALLYGAIQQRRVAPGTAGAIVGEDILMLVVGRETRRIQAGRNNSTGSPELAGGSHRAWGWGTKGERLVAHSVAQWPQART